MGFLEQFHLLIRYKKGKTNQLADWLSRPPLKVANVVMYREPSNSVIYKEQYIEDTCFQNVSATGSREQHGWLPFRGWVIVQGRQAVCSIGKPIEVDSRGTPLTGSDSQESVALKFVQKIQLVHKQVEEQLIKAQAKYKERHDKHRVDHSFQVGDMVWLYLGRDRMKGRHMKLKPIRYGPFRIIEQYGTNAFKLDLPSYMHMYSVANVENLRLFEPSLLDEGDDTTLLPVVHDLVPMERATTDMLLDRKTRKTRNGEQEFYWVCPKGQYPNRTKWYSQEQMQEKFPQLLIDAFEGPKASLSGRSDP
ncbi:kanadaptin-like protein [Corchorus olitorius]|uniref:Kanadaptin-like protein n=1 Tax=Corchorus olitorius TaxID=93759 RepID=A0A1R3KR72_9ROSI|nr:kanadaptin-like protein [Corchorus olitorius]